jgi:beta-glucanase (GH16 family)
MRRSVILAALAATLVASSLPVTADAATTTFTQVSLDVTMSGASVTATTRIAASSQVQVDQYGICARDAAWRNFDFPAKKAATISTSGTSFSATRTFPAGTFRYYPCVLSDGSWKSVGMKTFTVTTASSGPTVLFSDDFSGTGAYDHSKWGEWSSATYNGSAAYGSIKAGDRAALDGQGHLSVPATPTTGTSVSTASKFAFTYGTITARMKIQAETGYWPAFWTLNNNPTGQPNSTTVGEVDVIEAYTKYNDGYRRATHNYTPAGSWSGADDPLCGGGDVRGTWHDYSAKIEPGQVTFYFDGVQCGPVEKSTDSEAGGKPYAFGPDNPAGNWLLLTNAVGNSSQGMQTPTAPSVLLVDSVRVTGL